MNITEIRKDLIELNPIVKVCADLALEEIKSMGVNPCIVETYRIQERQYYLYSQKRTLEQCIAGGVPKAFAKLHANPKAPIVLTKTLNSIHIKRKAIDIVPQRMVGKEMKAIWDIKDPQTQIIINTMIKYGFEAGANWTSFVDSPHFQMDGNFDTLIMQGKTTKHLTKVIQIALNKKIGAGLVTDGAWGAKTTDAVNKFRLLNKWSQNGKLGAIALKELLV